LVKLLFQLRPKFIAEVFAVLFSLAYTLLYLNEFPICYVFGFLGSLLLSWVYVKEKLYAEVVLQWLYAGMAVYGYLQPAYWMPQGKNEFNHWMLISLGALTTIILGLVLKKHSQSPLPYADSFVAIFAILGTWLMVNYVNECWIYLFAINLISLFISIHQNFFYMAAMYSLYLALCIDGYFSLRLFVI